MFSDNKISTQKGTLLILCLLSLGSIRANAQALQLAKADTLWHFKITATGLYTDGNQPRSLFTNKGNLTKGGKHAGFVSNNTYQYGTVSKAKIVAYNDFRSENLLVFLPKKTVSPFARAFFETNKLRKIDFRAEWALGGFFKPLQTKSQAMSLMAAMINQRTNYYGSDFNIIDNEGSDQRNVWKWATGLTGFNTIVKDHLSAEYRLFYMQNVESADDYNYVVDLTLSAKILTRLSFNANYFQTFENVEMRGILPKEVQLTYGFSYVF